MTGHDRLLAELIRRRGEGRGMICIVMVVAALETCFTDQLRLYVRGASKIKVKKVNKKRTVTVRRLIIFLNISRRPLLICLQCCLHQYKTLKAVATATAARVLLTPAKNLKKVFLGFLVVSPLFNHFLG